MDERIRRLERLAASGDYQAREQLENIMLRFYKVEWDAAKAWLVDHPGDYSAWIRYMIAARDVGEDPQVGDPYYKLLLNETLEELRDVSRSNTYLGRDDNYSPRDREGFFVSNYERDPYVLLSHPTHPGDKAEYGAVISMLRSGHRAFARIYRNGTIDYWVDDFTDTFATRVVNNTNIPNEFLSVRSLLEFLHQLLLDI